MRNNRHCGIINPYIHNGRIANPTEQGNDKNFHNTNSYKMDKTISLLLLALVCAVTQTQGQVNPKISQLFEELNAMGKSPFGREPAITKRGGMDGYDNPPQLSYHLHLFYRPDLIRGRKDSLFVDSVLQAQKTFIEKQVKAIRRTVSELQKEAQDSLHYENHTGGKDTVFYSLNFCRDSSRVHKYSDDRYSYFYSDEFLDFVLESGKGEESLEGRFGYTISLPRIDPYSDSYSWGEMKADIKCLFDGHGITHRNALWQHDIVYSDSIWDKGSIDWIGMGTYGEWAYGKAGVTEATIYSLPEEQEPLAQQLLSQIDSLVLKFTEKRQECYYQYNYGVTFNGFTPQILSCYAAHIPETKSIQAQAADRGFHFLLLETRGAEWIPTEWYRLKSFINGKKEYFED